MGAGKVTLSLLGPPGSGKGTQARFLSERYAIPRIATGDIVREYAAMAESGNPLAREIHKRYVAGIPQPDDIINQALREKIASLSLERGILFDAYPLSVGQAEGLARICESFSLPRPFIIFLTVSEEEVLRRLGQRKFCKQCNETYLPSLEGYQEGVCTQCGGELYVRPDDQPEVVSRRYREYQKRMDNLSAYYREHPELAEWVPVSGEQSIDDVRREIEDRIEALRQRSEHGEG